MRKNFILFVLIPLIIFLVVAWFRIDRWVESGLERAGEELVGARVEIDRLDLTFSPLMVRFGRLEVASTQDSLRNLFETGEVHYTMDFGQLLRGKTIVDSMEVDGLILGTQRSSSGFLPGRRKGLLEGSLGKDNFQAVMDRLLQQVKASTPLFDPALWRGRINVDSLIKAQNFQTLALVDSLRQLTASSVAEWDTTLQAVKAAGQRLQEMKERILAIHPPELKSVEEVTKALATIDAARKTYNELTAAFNERHATIRGKVEDLSGAVGTIDDAVKADVRHVLSLARLPDINTMGLAELLIGQQVLENAERVAALVDESRALAARWTPKPLYVYPERMKGQEIPFPVVRGYPELWIKRLKISGGSGSEQSRNYIRLAGMVDNISSDHRLAGEPMSFTLDGTRGATLGFGLVGRIDRRAETPIDHYTARISGIRLPAFSLGKADFLPAVATGPTLAADVTISIPGSSFDVQGDLRLRALALAFQNDPRNVGERLARDILTGVTGFDAGFRLRRGGEGVNAVFTTDLDNQFADGVRRVVGEELTRLQNQLKARVEQEVAARRREFERYFAARREEVQKQLDGYKSLVEENKRMLEERRQELEARLEQLKRGAVDKVMDKILKRE